MSNKAIDWANALPLNRNLKSLLRALAHYHNGKDGRCFPKQETLADDTSQSVDTVQRQLKILESVGLITRERGEPAYRGNRTTRTSDKYTLHFHMIPEDIPLEYVVERGTSRATAYRRRTSERPTPQDETQAIGPTPQNETPPDLHRKVRRPTPQQGAVYIDERKSLERKESVPDEYNNSQTTDSLIGNGISPTIGSPTILSLSPRPSAIAMTCPRRPWTLPTVAGAKSSRSLASRLQP
jgi:DNA-binding transcriptional MocR family regulator